MKNKLILVHLKKIPGIKNFYVLNQKLYQKSKEIPKITLICKKVPEMHVNSVHFGTFYKFETEI